MQKRYFKSIIIKILSSIIVHSDFKTVLKKFEDQGSLRNEIEEYFELFKKAKEQNKIKEEQEKNIDFWGKKPFQEFKDFVDKLKETKTKSEEKKLKKMEGAELVAENDDYWVYKITNLDAVRTYGSGTKWCITQEDGKWWNKYKIRNDFYFYISKNKSKNDPLYKVAMTINRKGKVTYFDAPDKQIKEPPTKVAYHFPAKKLEFNSDLERIAEELRELYEGAEAAYDDPEVALERYGDSIENFEFHFDWIDDANENELIEQLKMVMGIDEDDYEDDVLKNELLDCSNYEVKGGHRTGYSIATLFIGEYEEYVYDNDIVTDLRDLSEDDLAVVQSLLDDANVYIDVSDPKHEMTFTVGQSDGYVCARIDEKKLASRIRELKLAKKISLLEENEKNLKYAERVALKSKHFDAVNEAIKKITNKNVLKTVLKRKNKDIRQRALDRLGTLYNKDADVQKLFANIIFLRAKSTSEVSTALKYANQKILKQFVIKDSPWEQINKAVDRIKDTNFLKKQCLKPDVISNFLHACLGREDVKQFADFEFLQTLFDNAIKTKNKTYILKDVIELLPLTSQDAFKQVIESTKSDNYEGKDLKNKAISKVKDQKYLYKLFWKEENEDIKNTIISNMSSAAINKLFDVLTSDYDIDESEFTPANMSKYKKDIVERSIKLKNKDLMLKFFASDISDDSIRELLTALPANKETVRILKSKNMDDKCLKELFWDIGKGNDKAKYYNQVFGLKNEE
jgi:hypothetical protein